VCPFPHATAILIGEFGINRRCAEQFGTLPLLKLAWKTEIQRGDRNGKGDRDGKEEGDGVGYGDGEGDVYGDGERRRMETMQYKVQLKCSYLQVASARQYIGSGDKHLVLAKYIFRTSKSVL
jgi:hypothetical protein